MVTGARGLEILAEEQLPQRAAALGDRALAFFKDIAKSAPIVGDVRGVGLMIGLEIVDPLSTPDKLGSHPPSPSLSASIQLRSFSRGLILVRGGREGAVLRLLCPLIVSEAEFDEMCGILGEAIVETSREYLGQ